MQIPFEQRRLAKLHSGPDGTHCCPRSPGAALQLWLFGLLAFLFHTSASPSVATQRKVESKLVSSCLLLLDDDMSSLNSTLEACNRGDDTELSFQAISALGPPFHLPVSQRRDFIKSWCQAKIPLVSTFNFASNSCFWLQVPPNVPT